MPPTVDPFMFLGLPRFHGLFIRTVVLKYFWTDQFRVRTSRSRELRSSGSRYDVPATFTRYGTFRRVYYVPRVFNDLPIEFYDITSLKALKHCLRQYVTLVSFY